MNTNSSPVVAPEPTVYELFWVLRSKILKLPRFSFLLGEGGGVVKVADRYGKWIEVDEAAALCESESVDLLPLFVEKPIPDGVRAEVTLLYSRIHQLLSQVR